jgi:hypothetical protein
MDVVARIDASSRVVRVAPGRAVASGLFFMFVLNAMVYVRVCDGLSTTCVTVDRLRKFSKLLLLIE